MSPWPLRQVSQILAYLFISDYNKSLEVGGCHWEQGIGGHAYAQLILHL